MYGILLTYILSLVCPISSLIHCTTEYSNWSQWSNCTTECGLGEATRARNMVNCNKNDLDYCFLSIEEVTHCFGENCNGRYEIVPDAQTILYDFCTDCSESPTCNGDDVPGISTCKYSHWSSWSECSVTCGPGGIKRRSRNFLGGVLNECSDFAEVTPCDVVPCPSDTPCSMDYSNWSQWSNCNVTCGLGEATRTRALVNCNENDPHYCLLPIKEVSNCFGGNCNGKLSTCNGAQPSGAQCNYSTWSSWGECSVTCGPGGMKRSSRNFNNAVPNECYALTKVTSCDGPSCPEPKSCLTDLLKYISPKLDSGTCIGTLGNRDTRYVCDQLPNGGLSIITKNNISDVANVLRMWIAAGAADVPYNIALQQIETSNEPSDGWSFCPNGRQSCFPATNIPWQSTQPDDALNREDFGHLQPLSTAVGINDINLGYIQQIPSLCQYYPL